MPDRGEAFPAPASPDAELLAACAEFDAVERAYRATDFNCKSDTPEDLVNERERGRLYMAQVPVLNRTTEFQAVTHAGQVARARSFALWRPELLEDGEGNFGDLPDGGDRARPVGRGLTWQSPLPPADERCWAPPLPKPLPRWALAVAALPADLDAAPLASCAAFGAAAQEVAA